MQQIFIVRHGEAQTGPLDRERPLTDEGRAQVQRLGRALAELSPSIDAAFHSSRRRARETAEGILSALEQAPPLAETAGLEPEDDPQELIYAMDDLPPSVMFVGHLPFVSRLATLLAGSDGAAVRFDPATLAQLVETEDGWRVLRVLRG